MIDVQLARLIANQITFLEFCDDEEVHPDTAIKLIEELIADLDDFDKEFLRKLIDAFPIIASEYDGEVAEFVREIPRTFSLADMLEADESSGSIGSKEIGGPTEA